MTGLFQKFLYINAAVSVIVNNASPNWTGALSIICTMVLTIGAVCEVFFGRNK